MKKHLFIALGSILLLAACSISYKFNGASIDYTKVKSITISDFPIRSAMVYASLGQVFNQELKDIFTRQTRLTVLSESSGSAGDMQIEGEITRYDIAPMAVRDNGLASQTRLTIGVNVRFTNNTNHEEDFEETFTAYRDFSADQMLDQVQDQLIAEISKELSEQIYNRSVANW